MELIDAIILSKKVNPKPGFTFSIVREVVYEGYPGISYDYVFAISKKLEKRNWWQKLWNIKTIEIIRNKDLNKLKEYINLNE
jgi:hypothetical protein